jgi:hypothetical protein
LTSSSITCLSHPLKRSLIFNSFLEATVTVCHREHRNPIPDKVASYVFIQLYDRYSKASMAGCKMASGASTGLEWLVWYYNQLHLLEVIGEAIVKTVLICYGRRHFIVPNCCWKMKLYPVIVAYLSDVASIEEQIQSPVGYIGLQPCLLSQNWLA